MVAVALDTSFFVGSGQLVHAADDTATETVVQQGNASDSSSADTSSSTTVEESTSSESTTETAPAEKTNSESTETADKQATEPAKASASATETSIPEKEASTSQSKAEVQEDKESSVSYDITIYDSAENTKSANPAGKISSSPDKPANLTPGNQNIYLRFNISGIKESDSPLTISFDNAGGLRNSSKDFVISYI